MFLKLNLLRLCLKSFQKVHFEIPAESTHTHTPPHAGLGDTDEQGSVGGGGVLTYVGTVAEEVQPQLQPHPVVTLIISELHVGHHLLDRGEGLESVSIAWGLHNCPADSPEAG